MGGGEAQVEALHGRAAAAQLLCGRVWAHETHRHTTQTQTTHRHTQTDTDTDRDGQTWTHTHSTRQAARTTHSVVDGEAQLAEETLETIITRPACAL